MLVISQDCDLVHESYEAEPKLEVIVAVPVVGQPDGNLTYGKNPRKLQVPFQCGTEEVWLQCSAGDRYFVPREILEELTPDPDCSLSQQQCGVLVRWLANRYRRAAFPDEFNDRIKAVHGKGTREIRRQGSDLTGIYLRLDTMRELPNSIPYKVMVYGTMEERDFIIDDRRTKAEALMQSLAEAIRRCDGIEVVDFTVVSEREFTLENLRQFKNWNFDSLTLRIPGNERLPPE